MKQTEDTRYGSNTVMTPPTWEDMVWLLELIERRLVDAGVPLQFTSVERHTYFDDGSKTPVGIRFDIELDGKEI